jgi:hypothetical protein
LVELALDRAAGSAAIHAAAVARGDRAVLLPGRSGVGKSTLAAGCVLNGWKHVADDTVVLDSAGQLKPLPLPLSLKREVWTVLPRAGADIESAAWHERADGLHVRYLAAPRRALGPCILAVIVAPQWRRGAAPSLRRLKTRAAFEALLPQYYPLANPFTAATIGEVAALVEGVPCFALTYDAVADGIELLERTLAR